MAAFALKGSLQGPCFMAAYLSGRNPQNSNFCNRLTPRSSVVPSIGWSMGNDKRHSILKAQLKRTIVVTDQHKRRQKALQQRARDFADGLVEYICSENENYKYVIIASKENANMLMEEGFVSSYARDDILYGLKRIENDIEGGRFQWRKNEDVRTNIIEALVEMVGAPAKRLDATINHYVQLLTVLRLWCHDYIDKVITQIKELQVELVLLAIRNEGLVLPGWRHADWILLGDMVLFHIEQLGIDVSRLVSCKNKMDSTLLTAFPSGSTDGSMNSSSLSKDGLRHIHSSVMSFGNTIIHDISHDLSSLEWDLEDWVRSNLLTPNDQVTESARLMQSCTWELRDFIRPFHNFVEGSSSKRFLAIYKIVPEILKATTELAKNSSFNHEQVQKISSRALHGTKDLEEDFKFEIYSGCTTGKQLDDWLLRLQSGEKN